MSRNKFAAKKSALSELSFEEKWRLLRFGEKCDPEALAAVRAIHNSQFLRATPDNGTINKQIEEQYRDEAWAIIAKHYREDCGNHDGSFFRKLADAMEVSQKIVDPVLLRIGGEILERERFQDPLPTATEMHRILAECEIVCDEKTVRRAFDFWGRTPTPPKRIPGQKRASVHRVSR